MTTLFDLNNVAAPGPLLDRFGRYLIPDPENGKQRSWTRATTIAKTLEDTTNLTRWKTRMTALGIAARPSLAAGAVANRDNKEALDDIVEQAVTAAGGDEGRDLGTNLHALCEQLDRGQITTAPPPWDADLAAYQRALHHGSLTAVAEWCEVVLLNYPLGVAGRVDNLFVDHEQRLVVGDKKTGGYLAWLSFAMQFAIYATSTHFYDVATGEVHPLPPIRQDHALLVHLPAGTGTCNIYPLSVPVGYDAVLMALEVRRMRARDKRPAVEAATWQPPILQIVPDPPPPGPTLRGNVTKRVEWCRDNQPVTFRMLAARWPEGVPTLKQSDAHTDHELDLISVVLDELGVPW